ncbi:MAG: hypothetical protein R2809_10815 [Flavobacteriales bacterium]
MGCAPLSVIFSYEGDANGAPIVNIWMAVETLIAGDVETFLVIINTIGCADITYYITDENMDAKIHQHSK